MAKDEGQFVLLSEADIAREAKRRGLELDKHEMLVVVGGLIGTVHLELGRLLDIEVIMKEIEKSDNDNRWRLVLDLIDLKR